MNKSYTKSIGSLLKSRKNWAFAVATALVIGNFITPEIWGLVASVFMGVNAAEKYISIKNGGGTNEAK